MEGVIRKTGELLHLVEVIIYFFSRLSIAFGVGVRVAEDASPAGVQPVARATVLVTVGKTLCDSLSSTFMIRCIGRVYFIR
jgi:hypothetical protein